MPPRASAASSMRRPARVRIGHVTGDRDCAVAGVGHGLFEPIATAGQEGDLPALFGQAGGDAPAEAARRSDDNCPHDVPLLDLVNS